MNQQKKKSKKTIKILFIFLGVLVLALIAAIVYFSLSGDIFQEDEEETITCGCYYIDPQVINTCGDPKRAFKFNTAQGTAAECNALCPLNELSTNMLYSTTPQDSYRVCPSKNIQNTQCSAMQITTQEGLTVTGKIPPDEPITVTATFDSDQYQDHTFLLNSIPTKPDSINGNSITKDISDFGESSTMRIVAQATNNTGDVVSSIICDRLIEITTTAQAGVSEFTIDSYTEDSTKIRSAIIKAGGLKDTESSSIKFTFKEHTLNMTSGFEVSPEKGRISSTEVELYNSTNFSDSNSFSLLDQYEGEVEITAEVIQDGKSLGSATASIDMGEDKPTEDPGKEPEPDTPDETQDPEPGEEPTPEEEVKESAFLVTKETSQSCLERVSPNNTTTFTITVKNSGDNTDTIESIKDKLPLGFAYVASSSKLNGNPIADSVFVTTTDVGQSEEIVWEPQSSWSITANGSLTITFDATAGSSAITGANLNEVIVTPTEIPQDPSTLRTSTELTVAQNCENVDEESTPQTGIFDTTIGRIVVGVFIILIGMIIHNTNQGNRLANSIINSTPYKGAEMTSYRIFKPKKYFEEKILQRRERER